MSSILRIIVLVTLCFSAATCRSFRERRETSAALLAQTAEARQIGGGLSALGTLVQPLLFLMGLSSFVSMLPGMFQNVMSGVGSNLISAFVGGQSSSSSGRFRRLAEDTTGSLLESELLKILEEALQKYDTNPR